LTPKSDSPTRLLERMSTRLPGSSARMRITMIVGKPNQSLCRPPRAALGRARATTSQPIAIAHGIDLLEGLGGGQLARRPMSG
jgi:hypothetical protein